MFNKVQQNKQSPPPPPPLSLLIIIIDVKDQIYWSLPSPSQINRPS